MPSRRPPSLRDPAYAPHRLAATVQQAFPGNRTRNATPVKQTSRQRVAPAAAGASLRPASIIVAASDSSAACKAGADVVCTGSVDQTPIQTAINTAGTGASVLLLPGNYMFSGRLFLNNDYMHIDGPGAIVHSSGLGPIELTGVYCSASRLTMVPGTVGLRMSGAHCSARGITVIGDISIGIDASEVDCSIIDCHVVGALNGYELNAHRTSLVGSIADLCQVGVQVYGQDGVVANNRFTGALVDGGRGDGIYLDRGNALRTVVTGNTVTGHYIGIDAGVREGVITGNIVSLSQREGISAYGRDTKVSDNHVSGSSQETNATYANISVGGSGVDLNQSVTGNTSRAQTADKSGTLSGNSASYGLELGGTGIFQSHNDLKAGGATAAFNDTGTGTVTGAANRT